MNIYIAQGFMYWLLRIRGMIAITLPPWGIFITPKWYEDRRVRVHEEVHWQQYERMGFFKFYVVYFFLLIFYGYKRHPMEVEAYEKSGIR